MDDVIHRDVLINIRPSLGIVEESIAPDKERKHENESERSNVRSHELEMHRLGIQRILLLGARLLWCSGILVGIALSQILSILSHFQQRECQNNVLAENADFRLLNNCPANRPRYIIFQCSEH